MKSNNFFEKYPKLTLIFILAVFGLLILFLAEKLAQSFGLGNVLIYDSHPVYGYRPQANQVVFRHKDKPIQINNLGLRAEQDWDENPTKPRILFLGDSVTYGGSYIKNNELFSSLAVQNIPSHESANAGVNAWGVLNVHALVKEMNFTPADIYVSVFPEGDFYRGLMRIGGQPFWTRQPNTGLEELVHYLIYKIQLTQTAPNLMYRLSDDEKYKIVAHAAFHLKEYDDFLKKENKQHLIYISPSQSHLAQKLPNDPLIEKAIQMHGLKIVYLRERIPEMPIEEIKSLFHDEIHLSPKGHQLWASIIEKDLNALLNSKA